MRSSCGEVTFRTQAAEAIIKEAAKRFPTLYLGAGTILNVHDLKRAFVESDFAFAPGVCTPSEVEQAHELGCKFLKFFPAEAAGGVKMLKSLIAPYKHLGIRFMPTGGVTADNVLNYLAIKEVVAVGGTWLGKADEIASGNWDGIRATVKKAVELKEGK